MKLNIIGNGFDLYHGLPSSYYYFGCYLIDNDAEFYEEIGRMYNIRFSKLIGPSIAHDYEYAVEDMFWRDFEKHLGEVDEYFIVDTNESDLWLENDDPIEIEMNEDLIAERLKQSFAHWVKDTLDKDDNYELIQEYMSELGDEIGFCDEDYFLVFNYTHTLQNIYNVTDHRIHYVHGECLGNDDDELIIGHGNDNRINEIETLIERFEQEYNYTQRSRNEIHEYRCLLRFLNRLRKNVSFCKFMCNDFYSKIDKEVECVKVFGLSLGEVDIPYLIQIRNRWPDAKWEFSFYSASDKTRIREIAETKLSLNVNEYALFRFSNPSAKDIRNRIINLRSIKEYSNFN